MQAGGIVASTTWHRTSIVRGVVAASFQHQALCKLLGERLAWLPKLLQTALGITLAHDLEFVPRPETIRVPPLPEHAADVVVAHRRATRRIDDEAFVFEVQLRPDEDKRWSWPIHLAGVRTRLACLTSLVVVAPDERTARWAARPIRLGRNQTLVPLVIGPKQIPSMLTLDEARACPELAALAVVMHGHEPGSKRLAKIAIAAALQPLANPHERDTLVLELILSSLSPDMLQEIEDEMELYETPILSPYAKWKLAQGRKQSREQGRIEGLRSGRCAGRRAALVLVLGARGLSLSPAERERIEQCTDSRQLDAWLRRAVSVASVAELFVGKPGGRPRAG